MLLALVVSVVAEAANAVPLTVASASSVPSTSTSPDISRLVADISPVTSRAEPGEVLRMPTFPSWRTVIASTSVPDWLSMEKGKGVIVPTTRTHVLYGETMRVEPARFPHCALKRPKSRTERGSPLLTIAVPLVWLS